MFDPNKYAVLLAEQRDADASAANKHRNIRCPKCDLNQSATHKKCSRCGHDLKEARKAKFAKMNASQRLSFFDATPIDSDEFAYQCLLAADSLAKASTPEPWSTSKTSNWIARVGGLPDYIQHISHGIARSGKHTESEAIEMAVGVCEDPPKNWGATAREACAKAVAEWEAKRAKAHAMGLLGGKGGGGKK